MIPERFCTQIPQRMRSLIDAMEGERGDAAAQFRVAEMHHEGTGTTKDARKPDAQRRAGGPSLRDEVGALCGMAAGEPSHNPWKLGSESRG